MAKGQVAKNEVAKIILDAFGDKAFLYNDGKEIRVNWVEAGEIVQIKVALTAAKDVLSGGNADSVKPQIQNTDFSVYTSAPTEEEKQNVANLLERLGI
jgi:hypothetical protein